MKDYIAYIHDIILISYFSIAWEEGNLNSYQYYDYEQIHYDKPKVYKLFLNKLEWDNNSSCVHNQVHLKQRVTADNLVSSSSKVNFTPGG